MTTTKGKAVRIPRATYRIQFNPEFRFEDARGLLGYLERLGISDVYASPIFRACKGSTHGYDVVDPNSINEELGTTAEFDELLAECAGYGLGWIQDCVPNHMAFDYENRMLREVLEDGRRSRFADLFDVHWGHWQGSLKKRILTPFLGEFYGEALEQGKLRLEYGRDGFTINYYDNRYPLGIETYSYVLAQGPETGAGPDPEAQREFGEEGGEIRKPLGADLAEVIAEFQALALPDSPSAAASVGDPAAARFSRVRAARKSLWKLYSTMPEVKARIDEHIGRINGTPGRPRSFDRLHRLLQRQHFRLAFWKVATEELNYRRFFSINHLISVRVEDERVFGKTHGLIRELLADTRVTGLRIDHVDGLYDPAGYLSRLRHEGPDAYIAVEKILEWEEELPRGWPVQGTTGYEFLNRVNGLFCDQGARQKLDRIYARFGPPKLSYEELVIDKKRLMIRKEMQGDLDNLAHLMRQVAGRYRHSSDITTYGLRRALVEVLTRFPVYRTYVSAGSVCERDRRLVTETVATALRFDPDLAYELSFIRRFLLLEYGPSLSEGLRLKWTDVVQRFQQFSGPLMAKGLEDTVLYLYNRLVSLNEVGGAPDRFGCPPEDFHEFNARRAELWPSTMNATASHDTKRGEDVRARINVLSEIPEEWSERLKVWTRLNRGRKALVDGVRVPERNDEYFLYQTLVGAFPNEERKMPEFTERICRYVVKAVREAKTHTAWLEPDSGYENGYVAFVRALLADETASRFLADLRSFQEKVAFFGMLNSLSQVLLKIASPGLPDFYQGTELWDLSLVDPDNRRPVDYARRSSYLNAIENRIESGDLFALAQELFGTWKDGRIKLFLMHRGLQARKRHQDLFRDGGYTPLRIEGLHKEKVVAFARELDGQFVVCAVPRLVTSLCEVGQLPVGEVWGDTKIALPAGFPGSWNNALVGGTAGSGTRLSLADAWNCFPGALLFGGVPVSQ